MMVDPNSHGKPGGGTPASVTGQTIPQSLAVAILVPVLHRPHRVKPLLESIEKGTPEPYRVVFIPDPDDIAEMNVLAQAQAFYSPFAGNYAEKINHGVSITDEPYIFTGADDLEFHEGWLEAAADHMISGGFQVVGTNDLCNPRTMQGEHATHFLVDRSYVALGTIDEPGKLFHEGYPHEYVDTEFFETANARKTYAHAFDSVVEHLHPMVGKAPMDELYAEMPARMASGQAIFKRRRVKWLKVH